MSIEMVVKWNLRKERKAQLWYRVGSQLRVYLTECTPHRVYPTECTPQSVPHRVWGIKKGREKRERDERQRWVRNDHVQHRPSVRSQSQRTMISMGTTLWLCMASMTSTNKMRPTCTLPTRVSWVWRKLKCWWIGRNRPTISKTICRATTRASQNCQKTSLNLEANRRRWKNWESIDCCRSVLQWRWWRIATTAIAHADFCVALTWEATRCFPTSPWRSSDSELVSVQRRFSQNRLKSERIPAKVKKHSRKRVLFNHTSARRILPSWLGSACCWVAQRP